jgi:hypothetical protein
LVRWCAPTNPTSTDAFLSDGEGHRVEQVATVNGTTTSTVYLGVPGAQGAQLEIAYTGSTTTKTAYYGGLALTVNGLLYYLPSDELGSMMGKINTSGGVPATQLMILPKNWTGPYVKEAEGKEPKGHTTYGHTASRARTSSRTATTAA